MATNYPGAIDNPTNPTASDTLDSATVPHATQHANANDAIKAIQIELGTNPRGTAATVKARLDTLDTTVAGKVSTTAGAVGTTNLADSSVTTAKIADNSITTAKIAAGAVVTNDLADSAVTTVKVADSAVTTAKIAANAVTIAKTQAPVLSTSGGVGAVFLVDNPALTRGAVVSGKATWVITHNFGRNPVMVNLMTYASGAPVSPSGLTISQGDTAGADATNKVTVSWTVSLNVSANTYRAIVIG